MGAASYIGHDRRASTCVPAQREATFAASVVRRAEWAVAGSFPRSVDCRVSRSSLDQDERAQMAAELERVTGELESTQRSAKEAAEAASTAFSAQAEEPRQLSPHSDIAVFAAIVGRPPQPFYVSGACFIQYWR